MEKGSQGTARSAAAEALRPETARWLLPWLSGAVAVLSVVTLLSAFVEAMPEDHHYQVPAATAVMAAAWAVELREVRWPRLALVAATVLANVWLVAIGHVSTNFHFLLLVAAWVGTVGSRTERLLAFALPLGTISLGAISQSLRLGQVAWTSWLSWALGLALVWLMALLLRRLDRLALENAQLLARAQESASLLERQRLARELHDSVAQVLYGIALGARTARTQLDRDPANAREPLEYVLSLAEAGSAEMRALIFALRPESLEQEGLVAALEKHAAALRARYDLEVDAALGPEPDVPLATKEALYRIAQEALHNTVKHARAGRVRLELAAQDGALVLEASDDGAGFDPRAAFPGHLGLRSMRERAAQVGGTVEIESAPGAGTRIRARVPAPLARRHEVSTG